MLTISFRKISGSIPKDGIYLRWLVWMVGDKLEEGNLRQGYDEADGWAPVKAEASGAELEWMGRNYTNIPRANPVTNPIQKWRGDIAAFIYDHLPRTK